MSPAPQDPAIAALIAHLARMVRKQCAAGQRAAPRRDAQQAKCSTSERAASA